LVVEATNYGRFNLVEFLLPLAFFRKRSIEQVWRQIRIVRQNNPDADISVIAHSFGTYVVAQLLKENFDIKFHRIIFCGSVVPYDFPFEQIQDRFRPPIVNEVGTRDIWPAMAESITLGYGSAGTYGFRRPLVRDRWHNGAGHNFFLTEPFCEQSYRW
jgi:pimeloyl-ACP methyl ester carboxylesterase